MKLIQVILATFALGMIVLPGCQAPNAYEKAGYNSLVAQGAPPIEEYSPALAGCLNLLPGIGDAYLGEWGPFAANFLLLTTGELCLAPVGIAMVSQCRRAGFRPPLQITFYRISFVLQDAVLCPSRRCLPHRAWHSRPWAATDSGSTPLSSAPRFPSSTASGTERTG